jgi:hypothetical protein
VAHGSSAGWGPGSPRTGVRGSQECGGSLGAPAARQP